MTKNMEDFEPKAVLKDVKLKKSGYWTKSGEKETLRLFRAASERVPAYKDFLKKNRIDPRKIKTLRDFTMVPPTDKANYLHAYPYEKLFWDGNTRKPFTIHATSGSTGEPTYFERERESDLIRQIIIEGFFRNSELTLKGPTLFIITFGMGIWSAGMGMYTAAYIATNSQGLPISIVSPGINKVEISKILAKLAPRYKQVIIAGYPPFVKDIIDNALQDGVDIKKFNLRIVFTGEAFTEEFRDYLLEKGAVDNIFADTMNTYGTSELGAVAVETPLTVLGRRFAYKNKDIFRGLFGGTIKTPTLAQYIPYFVNFDCVEGELYFTGRSPTPLIRYQSGDHGGILTFSQFENILSENGVNVAKEVRKLGIGRYVSELPLVFVYERKNLAATLYGILIYPEFIKAALFDHGLSRFLTGKFTMITKYDRRQNQYLELNLELRRGSALKKNHPKMVVGRLMEILRKKSSEFRELSDRLEGRVLLQPVFWPYEYPKYFVVGNKHKWMKKS